MNIKNDKKNHKNFQNEHLTFKTDSKLKESETFLLAILISFFSVLAINLRFMDVKKTVVRNRESV